MIYNPLITVNAPNSDREEPQNTVFAAFLYRPCSSRRKIREKRREDALLATSNIACLVTKSTGNKTAPK